MSEKRWGQACGFWMKACVCRLFFVLGLGDDGEVLGVEVEFFGGKLEILAGKLKLPTASL